MAVYLEKNINCLKKRNPILYFNRTYFEEIFDPAYRREDSVFTKDGVVFFRENGNEYQLTSIYPKKEVSYLLSDIDIAKDGLLVLFGSGNIEVLHWLLEQTSNQTKIAVIEPNIQVFLYMMEHYDFQTYIQSPKFAFITGSLEIVKQQVSMYFSTWTNLIQNIKIVMLPNYYLYQKFCLETVQYIRMKTRGTLLSLGNSLQDMLDGLRNHYLNTDACIQANSYEEYEGKYKGIPAIIVASGPSLDKNIQYLKQAQGKAMIIACDASYQICIENGVVPDAIASMERGEATYNVCYKDRVFPDSLVLVAPSLLWPKIHEEFPGKQLLFAKNRVGLEKWWNDMFPNIKFIDSGHSCATIAFGFAKDAGCEPIIMVGQDLAYTDNKLHSSAVRKEIFKNSNDATSRCEDSDNIMWTEAVGGGMVPTNMTFNLFRYFFEEQILAWGIHVIDATEGGALIKGAENMKLTEAIQKYCNQDIGFCLNDLLSDRVITKEIKMEYYDKIYQSSERFLEQIQELMDMAEAHYKRLEKYKDFDFDKASDKKLRKILNDLQKGNEMIEYIRKDGVDIATFYQHIIKYTVIYVRKIGNQLTSENIKRNWELQASLMNMFDITSAALRKEIDSMQKFLNEKKAQEAICL